MSTDNIYTGIEMDTYSDISTLIRTIYMPRILIVHIHDTYEVDLS